MKHTLLLTCCILAVTISLVKAQVTTKTFRGEVGILRLSLNNAADVKKDIDTLNTLMKEQIAYLGSYIKTLQVNVSKEKSDPLYKKDKNLQAAEQANAALIAKMTTNLTTDNNLYNSIQPLVTTNPPLINSVLLSDYTSFAATLQ